MPKEIKKDSTEVKEDEHAKTTTKTHEESGKPATKETETKVEKHD